MLIKQSIIRTLVFKYFLKLCEIIQEKGLVALIEEFMKINSVIGKILQTLPFPVEMVEYEETFEFRINPTTKK